MTVEPSPPRTLRSALPWLIPICLFAFAAQGYHFAKLKGLTWDESIYLATGHQALVESEFAFNPEHPALIKQLLAIPNAFAEVRDSDHLENAGLDQFGYGAAFVATVPVDPQGFILRGRMANLALGLVLIATLAWWARRMWGVPAGLLALVLGVTEPNFIAHASFAAFDIAAALGVVLPAYALWELLQRPRRSWLIAFGLAIGFGMGTKLVTTFLLIGVLIPVAVIHWWVRKRADIHDEAAPFWRSPATWGLLLLLIALPTLISYHFVHLGQIVDGFEYQFSRSAQSDSAPLFGEFQLGGHPDYFFYCLLLKVRLGVWALLIASLALFARKPRWSLTEFCLAAVPLASITFAMTLTGVNLGIRYILPSLAFMILAASRVASVAWEERNRLLGGFAGAMTAWAVFACISVSPHYLTYYNEIAGGSERGIRYLADSNIDWGQDLQEGSAFVRTLTGNPPLFAVDHVANPYLWTLYIGPIGWVEIFSLNVLKENQPRVPSDRDWVWISRASLYGSQLGIGRIFREREPTRRIGHSTNLYDITDEPRIYQELATHYLVHGMSNDRFDPDYAVLTVLERCVQRHPDNPICRGMLKAHRGRLGLSAP